MTRKTRNAVERNLEVIGEAARLMSAETRSSVPEIPWKSIIGLRNVIAHEYGEVRHDAIWLVCIKHLPPLIEHLVSLGADERPTEP